MARKVMCFGTFDLLHLGHIHYFKQAKLQGDHLIVVIACDDTKKKQRRQTIFTEKERKELVEQLRIVDEVVLGDTVDHFKIIQKKKPDILCLGYDQPYTISGIKEELAKRNLYPRIVRASPYKVERHKSSKLRKMIFKRI